MSLIKVQNLTKEYINEEVVTPVLHGVSFDINAGEFVAIMGPSGSGKSTLMHILSFLDRPTGGLFEFEGSDTKEFDDKYLAELRNERVGFVFQSFNLLARTSVLDNVKLPLLYSKKKNHDELAKKALDSVGSPIGWNFLPTRYPEARNSASQSRALVCDPAVIFADEPTGNLDSKSGNTVMNILQGLNDSGRTIILVTHEMDTANHAKRIIRVRDGNIVSDDPVINRTIATPEKELIK